MSDVFFRFVIIGAVNYEHDHYMSYIKRNNNREVHNNLGKIIKSIKSRTLIKSHTLMYLHRNITKSCCLFYCN